MFANMNLTKVAGRNKTHKVVLYAISTCPWCKKAKKFLLDNEIEYHYVGVDLCSREDFDEVQKDIRARGGRPIFPTFVIDNKTLLTNPEERKIRETLGILRRDSER
jgi:glutaredoxin-like protein NrdH